MARNVSKAVLVVSLGAVPEFKDLPAGQKVDNLWVFASQSWTGRTTGADGR